MVVSKFRAFDLLRNDLFKLVTKLILRQVLPVGLVWLILCGMPGESRADADSQFESRYREAYLRARTNWVSKPDDIGFAWVFARTTFDLAEFATNKSQRADLAREGIEAARAAIARDDQCAPAHYYLAMNLGQQARTELLGALRLVSSMEKEFKRVAELDAKFDFAGAERNLGILYREAPGWPASIGNKSKAKTHLKKAVELCPEYPANRLELLQSFVDWKETRAAEKMLPGVEECLAAARKTFSGEAWEWSWDEWETQWKTLQKRLQELVE